MTKIFKALCGTALALALVSPAMAQKADKNAPAAPGAGPVVAGIGVANLNAAVAASNAYQVAGQQRQTTYKATYDAAQAESRRQSRYLAAYVRPTLAESSRYPERPLLLGLAALFIFLVWSTLVLVVYALKDRR